MKAVCGLMTKNKFSKRLGGRLFVERSGRMEFDVKNLSVNLDFAEYVVLFVTDGTGILEVIGKDVYINIGDTVIIPPNTTAHIASDEYAFLKASFITFGGTDVNLLLKSVGASIEAISVITGELSDAVTDCFKNIFMLEDDLSGALAASGYFEIIFAELIKTYDGIKSEFIEKHDKRIVEVVKFIDEYYTKGIGVAEIAEHVKLERTYFTKLFKRIRGISPQSYLVELRLDKAAELLSSGQKADKVYEKVGYSDYQAFVRAFKLKFGVTPQKFFNG